MFKRDIRDPIDLHAHAGDRYAHQTSGGQLSATPFDGSFPVDKSIRYVKLSGALGFTGLAHIDDGGEAWSVAAGTSHIFLANYDDGLRAYTISAGGGTFTNVAHYADAGAVPLYSGIHVEGDGTIFIADDGKAWLKAFSFSGGTFTLLDSIQHAGSWAFDVTYDGTYVYMACGPSGVRAYTWIANNLTYKAVLDLGGADGSARGIWAHGGYIFVANWHDGLRAYTYAGGATITPVAHIDIGGSAYSVHGYGSYVFLANWDGIHAFSFDGVAFTHLSAYDPDTFGDARAIWTDGTRPYFANNDEGIWAANWSNEELSALAYLDNTSHYAYGIDGDSNFLYLACRQDGLRAYSIGGATSHVATITGGETGQLMIIEFQDSFIIIDDDDSHAADTIDLEGTATNLVSADDMILMIAYNGTSWYQTAPACVN